ncbi:hypothetical protein ACRE_003300 [Hapsidospora chrysogenum ATCC 11550]|uniref:Ecp2 effector protein domain-containing protein n=1 Tax=Hapsidospora chrysogenum (strain ATCC 11550 / CBS 779.69 / DSM 880 / IAM 14645 / JCM 23072 / IMI 49137) TaxID=857340 RepID=A0A086THE0_HAPC1|nr:hypothetical protein ACRE_003300 [Hapsidospora chrysogenum ATCC 11550]
MVNLASAFGLLVLAPLAALAVDPRPICDGLGPPANTEDAQACINWLRDQGSRIFATERWGSTVCSHGRAEISIVSRGIKDWASSSSGATIAAAAQVVLDTCKDSNGGVEGGAISDGNPHHLEVSIHLPVSMQPGWGK